VDATVEEISMPMFTVATKAAITTMAKTVVHGKAR